jgi:pimeloyl-ACP methyl ester carboxylesterase
MIKHGIPTEHALAAALLGALAFLASVSSSGAQETVQSLNGNVAVQVHHRKASIGGLEVFYREAGPKEAPAILLLHGFPTSSHMYRDLIPALADKYRVVAPDYPGFGQSSAPDRATFTYSFDNYAKLIDEFTRELRLERYALYVMDYGAPIGFRLAARYPERVTALIVQNGNA